MSRRFLATTSLSAAALLVAAGAATPALAAEETATETSAVAESVASAEATETSREEAAIDQIKDVDFGFDNVQNGYVVSSLTGHYGNVSAENLEGLKVQPTREDFSGIGFADKAQFTQTFNLGEAGYSLLDGSATSGVFKDTADVRVLGAWTSSNEAVFTVKPSTGDITTVSAGSAELTFTPYIYDREAKTLTLSTEHSYSTTITVVDPNATPAPEETAAPEATPAPAPEETAAPEVAPAPAPEETAVPEETVAPAPSETPAPEAAPEETVAPEAAPASEETVAPAEPVVEEAPVAVDLAAETFAYENCDAVKVALGRSISSDEPGYAPHLDSDSDGIGCEANDNYTGTYYDANNTVYASGTGDYYNGNDTGTYYFNNSGHSELAATGLSNGQLAATGLGLLVAGAATVTYRGRHFAR